MAHPQVGVVSAEDEEAVLISQQRGKKAEQKIAVFWGGRRLSFQAADIEHAYFSIEAKCRSRLPQTILNWYQQARRAAPRGKIPMVVLHELNARYEDDLVVLRAGDLKALLEPGDGRLF